MEKINPIDDLLIELEESLRTPTIVDGGHALDPRLAANLMLIKRLDSIDKTLSDLVYKKGETK